MKSLNWVFDIVNTKLTDIIIIYDIFSRVRLHCDGVLWLLIVWRLTNCNQNIFRSFFLNQRQLGHIRGGGSHCDISILRALEIPQSCTMTSICHVTKLLTSQYSGGYQTNGERVGNKQTHASYDFKDYFTRAAAKHLISPMGSLCCFNDRVITSNLIRPAV